MKAGNLSVAFRSKLPRRPLINKSIVTSVRALTNENGATECLPPGRLKFPGKCGVLRAR